MILTPYDLTSPTWKTLETHLTARLDSLRQRNDGRMPDAERGVLIGQIEEVKSLLALGQPAPALE